MSISKRIAILDDYGSHALESADWVGLGCNVTPFRDHVSDIDALADRLKGFEIIVCMRERTPFPAALLERLPKLELLVTTGMRNHVIDMREAAERGITVCGTRGRGIQAAEHTWGLILATARHIPCEVNATRSGRWQTTIGDDMDGKTLGVIGLGKLGERVARVGLAFGMRVLAWSQNLTAERCAEIGVELAASKEELMSSSDYVTVHVVLSERSRGLIGAHELGLMKPTAYLFNTSRGPIVDEAALLDALQNHRIAGAGLDVFDQEPLPPDHPLHALDNVVLTPHIGFVTREAYKLYYGDCVEDIEAYLAGAPVRQLLPEGRIAV
jgi:phosphoglycerate dehydrogenase-like enzyme